MQLVSLIYLASSFGAIAGSTIQSRKVTYDGFGVFRLPVGSDMSRVAGVVEKLGLDTWKSFNKPGAYADVVVPPEKLEAFHEEIADLEGVEVMHEDLGASIVAEQQPAVDIMARADISPRDINTTWFSAYHSYSDHLSYLTGLQTRYPDNVRSATSGTSLQGNVITGIQIYGSAGPGVNPAIVFHGTVHAREWVTTLVSCPRFCLCL